MHRSWHAHKIFLVSYFFKLSECEWNSGGFKYLLAWNRSKSYFFSLGNYSWSYIAVHRSVNWFCQRKKLLQINKFWSLGCSYTAGFQVWKWTLSIVFSIIFKVYFLVKCKLKSKCFFPLPHWSTRMFISGKKHS